jgi:hypothetical protein
MSLLLEIAIDFFGLILGRKSQDELSKGNKRKAYILLSVFLILVAVMGLFSLVWLIGFF